VRIYTRYATRLMRTESCTKGGCRNAVPLLFLELAVEDRIPRKFSQMVLGAGVGGEVEERVGVETKRGCFRLQKSTSNTRATIRGRNKQAQHASRRTGRGAERYLKREVLGRAGGGALNEAEGVDGCCVCWCCHGRGA
jgi:hypothetical protein